LITILAAILVFGVLITVHELGHFITAKATGMRVDEFAIGFGPLLYQTKSAETTYSLRLIPLGGYNKIAGMEPGAEAVTNGFSTKSIPARMLVILAGSLMNFLLPIVLFFGIFAISGVDVPVNKPVLGTVVPKQAASDAGLMPDDKILAVNGQQVSDWNDLVVKLKAAGTNEVTLHVDRAGSLRDYKMKAVYNEEVQRPLIGVSPKFMKQSVGFLEAGKMSVSYTHRIIISMVNGLQKIITGKAPAEVAGPIGVAQMAGDVASQGLLALLSFIAFLSLNLAIINLLPIPALDGGHFVVLLVEAVRGKPLAPRYMEAIQMVGIAIILALTIFSTVKDITR
jgi:regulator of sigma E protease